MFNAGDQVPVIPLSDVVGNADNAPPEQIVATALNVGVICAGSTVIILVCVIVLLHGSVYVQVSVTSPPPSPGSTPSVEVTDPLSDMHHFLRCYS